MLIPTTVVVLLTVGYILGAATERRLNANRLAAQTHANNLYRVSVHGLPSEPVDIHSTPTPDGWTVEFGVTPKPPKPTHLAELDWCSPDKTMEACVLGTYPPITAETDGPLPYGWVEVKKQ